MPTGWWQGWAVTPICCLENDRIASEFLDALGRTQMQFASFAAWGPHDFVTSVALARYFVFGFASSVAEKRSAIAAKPGGVIAPNQTSAISDGLSSVI
jgi:hypothetical protein